MQKAIENIKRVAEERAKDLCGFAAQAALAKLTSNWQDAVNDGHATFGHPSMIGDVEELVDILLSIKVGLSDHSNAEANMRRDLGLDFELPAFDESDDQMKWVEHVRKHHLDVSPKEVFRMAEAEYHQRQGKLPSADDCIE